MICAIAFSILACENQENEFDDFGSTSVYFPFQTPVRTLIQGKYDLGFNDNDNNGRFEMGVVMSGVYENGTDRRVFFEVDPSLIDLADLGASGINVKVLPEAYYTIEQESPVTIPAGSTKGRIPVQLNDAFFDDPLSFVVEKDSVNYVLPVRITGYEGLDSLLTGVPNVGITDPKRVRDTDWATLPKDYTLFGIKFMNKYQGIYLRRGEDKIVGTSEKFTVATGETETTVIDTSTIYKQEYVVQDELAPVSTAGRNKAITSNIIRRADIPSGGDILLDLTFNDNEEITISNADEESDIVITGSGRFVEDGDAWGGKSRDVMYLEYEYQDVAVEEEYLLGIILLSRTTLELTHTVNDTLVVRDRDVVFEEFNVNLTTPTP
ncbi:DUF5627 domain-containing protein [Cognatitamlana onchidii]|uniref:DUF5627 domain-containing protein n=1 Tax=Cognatitamlana onchidii TaxID=2562860 RepID=UPI0014560492|nr:DUF5627 domain-containing protein [Algibacter onchidii]